METVIVDTGVWFAIFDSRDQRFKKGPEKRELLEILQVAVPWPTTFETLRSRFVKNSKGLAEFERFLQRPEVVLIDDHKLREEALKLCFQSSLRLRRPLSIVDCLIRLMIEDPDFDVQYLATFNERDFLDVCHSYRVEII